MVTREGDVHCQGAVWFDVSEFLPCDVDQLRAVHGCLWLYLGCTKLFLSLDGSDMMVMTPSSLIILVFVQSSFMKVWVNFTQNVNHA